MGQFALRIRFKLFVIILIDDIFEFIQSSVEDMKQIKCFIVTLSNCSYETLNQNIV